MAEVLQLVNIQTMFVGGFEGSDGQLRESVHIGMLLQIVLNLVSLISIVSIQKMPTLQSSFRSELSEQL